MGSYIVIISLLGIGVLMGVATTIAMKFADKGQINPTVNFKRYEDMDAEKGRD